jgi:hypothetical protein
MHVDARRLSQQARQPVGVLIWRGLSSLPATLAPAIVLHGLAPGCCRCVLLVRRIRGATLCRPAVCLLPANSTIILY